MQAGQLGNTGARAPIEGKNVKAPRTAPQPRLLALALAGALATIAVPSTARAQAGATHEARAVFNLPAQPLLASLRALGQQTRYQVLFDEDLVARRQAPALSGSFTPREAIDRLLAGSGLVASSAAPGSFTVRLAPPPAPAPSAATALPAVTVAAQAERSETTQGTGSYTSARVSLGKGQTIRETPQSITVVTRQRIEDQGLTSVGEVMQQTTGITVDVAGSGGPGGTANAFYARGFRMSSVQIDGAAIDAFSQNTFDPNLAMYDSVQVIRGADGLFGGTGEPGGSINLVRKRPLAQAQTLATLGVGSWNQRRAELDVSGPLALEGRVRGRAVIAHTDREFFYDHVDGRNSLLYGILETDLTPDTKLTVGGSYDKSASTPWRQGLPRATSGADLGLPRSTSLTASWSQYDRTAKELFAQLEHQLAGDWRIKLDANYMKLNSETRIGNLAGAVDPTTGLGSVINGNSNDFGSEKKAIEINASGPFSLLGRQHKLLVGADWKEIRDYQNTFNSEVPSPTGGYSVYGFDPTAVPRPTASWMTRSFPAYGATQKGLYGRLNLSVTDRLTAIAGARYASFAYESPTILFNRAGAVTSTSMSAYQESGIFTPYGGLVFDIDDRWTAYGSVAEIHKSQSNLLQGPTPGTPLDAITGRNYELGVKGELAGGRLNTSLAVYRIERNGEGVRDPNYPSTAVGDVGLNCCWLDQGKVVSQGIDAEISGEIARGWQAFAGYTYNRNRNKSAAAQVAYHSVTPKHLFKLWTTYQLPGALSAWTLGGGANLQSAHFVSGTANAYNPATGLFNGPASAFNFSQGGYAVWSTTVQYRFHPQWTAVLNLNNLFDKTYYRTVGTSGGGNWYGEPRNAMLTLRGTF